MKKLLFITAILFSIASFATVNDDSIIKANAEVTAYNDSVIHVADSLKAEVIDTAVDTGIKIVPEIISHNYPAAIATGSVGLFAIILGLFKLRKAKKGLKKDENKSKRN